MSQLAKKLCLKPTERKVYDNSLLNDVLNVENHVNNIHPDYAYEYKLTATFETKIVVSHIDQLRAIEPIDVTNRARRSIVEAVFGEFRPFIEKVGIAIDQRNYREAHNQLAALHKQMFSTE